MVGASHPAIQPAAVKSCCWLHLHLNDYTRRAWHAHIWCRSLWATAPGSSRTGSSATAGKQGTGELHGREATSAAAHACDMRSPQGACCPLLGMCTQTTHSQREHSTLSTPPLQGLCLGPGRFRRPGRVRAPAAHLRCGGALRGVPLPRGPARHAQGSAPGAVAPATQPPAPPSPSSPSAARRATACL